uniref:Uncharacterized protein n=1 Tax=Onchocerca volvulus TaxID=6282 RepID=A0A8R1Y2R3_ONCVO
MLSPLLIFMPSPTYCSKRAIKQRFSSRSEKEVNENDVQNKTLQREKVTWALNHHESRRNGKIRLLKKVSEAQSCH